MITQVDITGIIAQQRRFFTTGKTKNIQFRIEQIKLLKQAIQEQEEEIVKALYKDLKRPKVESLVAEISLCLKEIKYTLQHLKPWSKPQKVPTPLALLPGSSQIISEPLGVVLIISPWNYPFQLAIAPLIHSIAAGNCAIIKPSEIASHTSQVIAKLIAKIFPPEFITVMEGDKEIATQLLQQKFDHIFFTGSTAIGKIVMETAAKHLTSVTLELGGKSPCIVDSNIDIEVTAKRITWGKFINAGQTCIAPDYLLVHNSIKEQLLTALKRCLKEFYGLNPATSPDYSRIISDKHFQRLCSFLNEGKIVVGGETNLEERYIAPTIIEQVTWEHKIMAEEIFGPILPILTYQNLSEAITTINSQPKPLALYIFSKDKQVQEQVLQKTSSGGVGINETISHIVSCELPFGGVGMSGMGSYHGKAGFDTFSHRKSVLRKPFWLDMKLKYPPYEGKLKFLKLLLEKS